MMVLTSARNTINMENSRKKAKLILLISLVLIVFLTTKSNVSLHSQNSSVYSDTVQITVSAGWNLISLPIHATDTGTNAIFPHAVSNFILFSFFAKYYLAFVVLLSIFNKTIIIDLGERFLYHFSPSYLRVVWPSLSISISPIERNLMVTWRGIYLFIFLITLFVTARAQDTLNGFVWYPPIGISDSNGDACCASIALTGDDTIHITWEEGGFRLPYARSTNGGVSFEPPRELLTDSVNYPSLANGPEPVVSNSRSVFIFFINITTSPLRMLESTDGGTSFLPPRDIWPEQIGQTLQAAINGDTIAVTYPSNIDTNTRILISTDNGQNWFKSPKKLGGSGIYWPKINISPTSLFVVRHRFGGKWESELFRSSDLGNSWPVDTLLSTDDGYVSYLPTISSYTGKCGTVVLTAWVDTKYGSPTGFAASIISRAGLNDGGVWLPEVLLTPFPRGTEPRIGMNGNFRAVTWWYGYVSMPIDSPHVAINVSNSSLTRFSPMMDLTPNSFIGTQAEIAVSHHAVHLVYEKEHGYPFRIYYRRGEVIQQHPELSISTGLVAFGTTEVNLTRNDSVTVTNTGSDPLQIGSAVSDNLAFSVSPESALVAPGGSTVFHVTYSPAKIETDAGRIIFFHNGQSSPDCFTVSGVCTYNSETVSYTPKIWNLISKPVKDGPVVKLPSLISYGPGGYQLVDSMNYGTGYWAKPADSVITYHGIKIYSDSFQVWPGWNILESISKPVPIINMSTSPAGIITSSIYGYNGLGYISADTIQPGRAYWVKVKQSGKVILK